LRLLSVALVNGLKMSPRWRLMDLWNDTFLLGAYCLRVEPYKDWQPFQPTVGEAAVVLGVVCILCLTYLTLRIRAVEIVR